ncbi:MAG: acetate--CoA ligase family protein [Alphaproteobacteria bacterium]|nr:acetate--CoA ligase family protein [Alphaproteobacteria bacterium]
MGGTDPGRGARSLLPMMKPRSIAVIGASDDPTRIGGRPVRYCKEHFDGPLYPVNPNRPTIQGLTAYKSARDIPEAPDCAILVVPAAATIQAVEDCVARGIKGLVVLSSGFAEVGSEGAAMQARVAEIARKGGARLLGPNCLGAFNAQRGNFMTFSSSIEHGRPKVGHIAIASQSGAYGSHLFVLARQRGFGISSWITTGNEADVDVADAIDFFVEDPETHVICLYSEGLKERDRLFAALEAARKARKPVVMMKVGRSAIGAEAARAHTASLAGSDAVCDMVLKSFGVHRAMSADEMFDVAYAAARRQYPVKGRLGIMTISGGAGVLMSDAAADYGLEMPPMPEDAQAGLRKLVPFSNPRNPVDITGQAFNDLTGIVTGFLDAMIEKGGYDAIAGFFTSWPSAPSMSEPLRKAVKASAERKPGIPFALSILAPPAVWRQYEAEGFLCYEDPTRAVAALAALVGFGRAFERPQAAPAPALPAGALPAPAATVGEAEAKRILASAGIPVVEDVLAKSADEAAQAAAKLGYPVVLKVASPDIAHKSEMGGVMLGLADADAVRKGFAELEVRVAKYRPGARLDGILVSPMVAGGVECILGVNRDPVFGPVVAFGLGGIFVEIMKDSTLKLAPFAHDEAKKMIRAIKGFPLLDGARGRPKMDQDALADALVRLSVFAAANADRIESIDINPFIVLPKGGMAVDALIVPRKG